MQKYLTPGELAKLADTTKRTIHFYDEKGVLKPVEIGDNHYRRYEERQVLDYQMILLLTTLGIPLSEIKQYLANKGQLADLFEEKKPLIRREIDRLQFNLTSLERYLTNLQANGTMVDPKLMVMKPFKVYYLDKVGPYVKIADYCAQLKAMFETNDAELTTLAIFEDTTYQPKNSRMKIGVVFNRRQIVKPRYRQEVQKMTFSPGKVITYTHHGSGSLLSLFWKELEKYCRLNKIKVRLDVPDFEIYRQVSEDVTKQRFEIYLPVE